MPRLDGTGPTGQGQRTGRGLGPCNRSMQTWICPRCNFAMPNLKEQEKMLKQQLAEVQAEINAKKPQ